MLLQETGIPDNLAYLVLGLAVLFLLLGGWVGSYLWRLRNLRRDMAVLEAVAEEDAPTSAEASSNDEAPASNAPHAQPT